MLSQWQEAPMAITSSRIQSTTSTDCKRDWKIAEAMSRHKRELPAAPSRKDLANEGSDKARGCWQVGDGAEAPLR